MIETPNRDCPWCGNTIDPTNYWTAGPEYHPVWQVHRFHAAHCVYEYLAHHNIQPEHIRTVSGS